MRAREWSLAGLRATHVFLTLNSVFVNTVLFVSAMNEDKKLVNVCTGKMKIPDSGSHWISDI